MTNIFNELEEFGPCLKVSEEAGLKIIGRTVKSAADAGAEEYIC